MFLKAITKNPHCNEYYNYYWRLPHAFFSFHVGKNVYLCNVKHPEVRKGEGRRQDI